MRKAIVCGAGGFIGHHLVKQLKAEGCWVRAVDLRKPSFSESPADEFRRLDLRDPAQVREGLDLPFDEVWQLAADMGGAGYIFSGDNDAAVMSNSALINLHVLEACHRVGVGRVFFSSSACVYPLHHQLDPSNPHCEESSAYPAAPDSEYGWEKLFSERLYSAYARNHGLTTRIARFHNVFGPEGTWHGGKEKAPAAICRKVAQAKDGGEIEIWGDGAQTRSFLYIDECIEGCLRLMRSDFAAPVNIGSKEMITINDLASLVAQIAGKRLTLRHVAGPQGVRGRTSDNRLIQRVLGWAPSAPLRSGLETTYRWVEQQVRQQPGL